MELEKQELYRSTAINREVAPSPAFNTHDAAKAHFREIAEEADLAVEMYMQLK